MALSVEDIQRLCGNLVPPGTLTTAEKTIEGFRERSKTQQEVHEAITSVLGKYMDKVPFKGRLLKENEKLEWDALVDLHAPESWFGQLTGSCVGTNSANIMLCEIAVENLIKKTGEELNVHWWWPYTYGWGRHYMGDDGEGEGSYLSVQYKAFREKGFVFMENQPDLTPYSTREGAKWLTKELELYWSSIRNIDKKWDDIADDHLVLDGAMITTMEELDDALMSGPVGLASMFGSNKIYTKNGVKMSDWSARWPHDMGIVGIWNHPQLGMLYKWCNRSWGASEYAWFWTTKKTVQTVLKDRGTEVMVIRDFKGIEEAGLDLEWLINFIMSLVAIHHVAGRQSRYSIRPKG